jgi:hypothetical protein
LYDKYNRCGPRNHCVWSKRIGWQIVHEKSYRQKSLIFKEVAV